MLALLLYAVALVMLVIGISLWLQSSQLTLPQTELPQADGGSDVEKPLDPRQVSVIEQLERQFRNSPSHNPDS